MRKIMRKKPTTKGHKKLKELYDNAIRLKKSDREGLAARLISTSTKQEIADRRWPKAIREKLNLDISATIFVQDPYLAKKVTGLGIQETKLKWESGLLDGPTSSRIAVVDYDGDMNILFAPASWNGDMWRFVGLNDQDLNLPGPPDVKRVAKLKENFQFHQVNVWAIISSVLEFFQSPSAMGRLIPWGFEGNRLIVVPHAGYGKNAFYDRRSKSLQFYYFVSEKESVFTCLSHDIIAHETGHAILDGLRPYYNEINSYQTPAFHEFVADLSAILTSMRNNDVRHALKKATKGDLTKDKFVANVAEEFGKHVKDREFLRTAHNKHTMKDVDENKSAHFNSQVLTGAIFDMITEMAANYMHERNKKPLAALWYTIDRFTRVALQPLDFCPPVDIQFEDYTTAMLRCDTLANPLDPYKYRAIMRKVFKARRIPYFHYKIEPDYSDFFCGNIDLVSSSRMQAYDYIHSIRKKLFIPEQQDITVLEPYQTNKVRRLYQRRPKEVVLQYIWREDVELKGKRFAQLENKKVPLLCGGTLVFDDEGNLLHWCRKPGTHFKIKKRNRGDKAKEENELSAGKKRLKLLLDYVASLVAKGEIGLLATGESESINIWSPVESREAASGLKLEISPRLHNQVNEEGE